MWLVKRESTNGETTWLEAKPEAAHAVAARKPPCFPLSGSDSAAGSAVSLNIGISAMRSQTQTLPAPGAYGGYTA